MSPVCAPCSPRHGNPARRPPPRCPPAPRATAASTRRRRADQQLAARARGARRAPRAPAPTASARRPFIFQLPAISWRMRFATPLLARGLRAEAPAVWQIRGRLPMVRRRRHAPDLPMLSAVPRLPQHLGRPRLLRRAGGRLRALGHRRRGPQSSATTPRSPRSAAGRSRCRSSRTRSAASSAQVQPACSAARPSPRRRSAAAVAEQTLDRLIAQAVLRAGGRSGSASPCPTRRCARRCSTMPAFRGPNGAVRPRPLRARAAQQQPDRAAFPRTDARRPRPAAAHGGGAGRRRAAGRAAEAGLCVPAREAGRPTMVELPFAAAARAAGARPRRSCTASTRTTRTATAPPTTAASRRWCSRRRRSPARSGHRRRHPRLLRRRTRPIT